MHDPAARHEDFTDGYRRELLLFQLNKHEENHPIITKQIADLITTIIQTFPDPDLCTAILNKISELSNEYETHIHNQIYRVQT